MVKSNILNSSFKFQKVLIEEKLNTNNILEFIEVDDKYIVEMVDQGKKYFYVISIYFLDVLSFVLLDTDETDLYKVALKYTNGEISIDDQLDKMQNNNIPTDTVMKLFNTIYAYALDYMDDIVIFQALKSEKSRVSSYDMVYRLMDKDQHLQGIFTGNFNSLEELREFNSLNDIYIPEEYFDTSDYKLYVIKFEKQDDITIEESKYFKILDNNKYSNDKFIRKCSDILNRKLIKEIK